MDNRAKLHKVTPEQYRRLRRFSMAKPPVRQRIFLRPLTWILSFPDCIKHKAVVKRSGMEKVRPPFILLNTHMAFLDFKITTKALFPWRTNYVVAIDGFIGREGLLRQAGGVLKRRVVNDVSLIRHIKQILSKHRDILSIYPEARYSIIGTPARLPESLGKLIKLFKVPVVMLRMHGNYLSSPVWDLRDRGNKVEAELFPAFSPEQLEIMTVDEINRQLEALFRYDEYAWQKENRVSINFPQRAEGLHHAIYLCPACMRESAMDSKDDLIFCTNCGKQWRMTEFGEMEAVEGVTEFPHLPDWYAFQVQQVRKEIGEGRYSFTDTVRVESLVNKRGYYDLGKAELTHDYNGFVLKVDPAFMDSPLIKKPASMYSCHIEYDYFKKGDCFELSTMDETLYLYPLNKKNVVTKILIATEELYALHRKEAHDGRP